MIMAVMQWLRILHTENEDLLTVRFDWQMKDPKFKSRENEMEGGYKQNMIGVCL